MPVTLYGYRYSVYLRIARMALIEKQVGWSHVEVDPFAEPVAPGYLALNPFGRVPTLRHDQFLLYETSAITRYVDEAFPGRTLQPASPPERARMNQMIAIADAYGYWPMVRQVFSQRVFNPARGRTADEAAIAQGAERARLVLSAVESLASGGRFLVGETLTLADLHLGAMAAYFAAAPEGADLLARHPKLSEWWIGMRDLDALATTDPGPFGA